jgi:hypothetical protein
MSEGFPEAETSQALFLQLAWERLRQEAIDAWLTKINADPQIVTREPGGELWLLFTRSACEKLREFDYLLEEVQSDLIQGCHLILERDKKSTGPALKINSESWFLHVKPGNPAWVVISIKQQKSRFPKRLIDLQWQLIPPTDPNDEGYDSGYQTEPTPLPLWLLARSEWRDADSLPTNPRWATLPQSEEETLQARRLNEMRRSLAPATRDLREAFELLLWEREHRKVRSWKLQLSVDHKEAASNGRSAYIICTAKPEEWPDLPISLKLDLSGQMHDVEVVPDPKSASRWFLYGPPDLPSEVTVQEPPEQNRSLKTQKSIAESLSTPQRLAHTAVAATQIKLSSSNAPSSKITILPEEKEWEPRQQEAIELSLAEHPVCAIKGPPGTGKSTVIVGIIRRLIAAQQRVLLVAPTHVALDEVLSRIHKLRGKHVIDEIHPARVAPADERRAQIRTELQNYIARNLGREIASRALPKIRAQLDDLTKQSQLFADLEARFSSALETVRLAERSLQEQKRTRDEVHEALGVAQQNFDEAHAVLKEARARERKRRPDDPEQVGLSRSSRSYRQAAGALRDAKQKHSRLRKELKIAEREALEADRRASQADTELQVARTGFVDFQRHVKQRLLDDSSAIPVTGPQVSSIFADLAEAKEVLGETNTEFEISDEFSTLIRGIRARRQAATAESAITAQRRELLLQWQEFYERSMTNEELSSWALDSVNLVAATTQGIAGSKDFSKQLFDVVICDESSRVTRGEILVPAARGKRIVLVGDEKQLPPYVETADEQLIQALAIVQLSENSSKTFHEIASNFREEWNTDEPEYRIVRDQVCARAESLVAGGSLPAWPESVMEVKTPEEQLRRWRRLADALTVSCFDHALGLLGKERTVRLDVQRRMVPEIAELVSQPVYGGEYRSPETPKVRPLTTDTFSRSWMFFNTTAYCTKPKSSHRRGGLPNFYQTQRGTGFINEGEARAVVVALADHIESARRLGEDIDGLMVITFYLAQAREIEGLVSKSAKLRNHEIAVLPVDRCQGQEADVVVVSFVRTPRNPLPNTGRWLQDPRRLNVALTRARRSLILIGNLDSLASLSGDKDGEEILDNLVKRVRHDESRQIEELGNLL